MTEKLQRDDLEERRQIFIGYFEIEDDAVRPCGAVRRTNHQHMCAAPFELPDHRLAESNSALHASGFAQREVRSQPAGKRNAMSSPISASAFNQFFAWAPLVVGLLIYLVLIGSAGWLLVTTPQGFIPAQDRGYVIVSVQLPGAASLARTTEIVRKIESIALDTPGIIRAAVSGRNRSEL